MQFTSALIFTFAGVGVRIQTMISWFMRVIVWRQCFVFFAEQAFFENLFRMFFFIFLKETVSQLESIVTLVDPGWPQLRFRSERGSYKHFSQCCGL